MIDFHCHIDLYPKPVSVADRCVQERLHVLSVTTVPSAWRRSRELLERPNYVRVALGLHPQLAHERAHEVSIFEAEIAHTKYVGEIGLDGSPEYKVHQQIQRDVFARILTICARAGGRVLSLHSRHAAGAVLNALELEPKAGVAVLHWFSGSSNDLARAVRLGCWFSIGPAMLMSKKGRALALAMPRERVLTETDGPFAKVRDEVLSPWNVQIAVAGLAELWGLSEDDADIQLRNNLRVLLSPS